MTTEIPDEIELGQGAWNGKATGLWHPKVKDLPLIRQLMDEAGISKNHFATGIPESDLDKLLFAAGERGITLCYRPPLGRNEFLD